MTFFSPRNIAGLAVALLLSLLSNAQPACPAVSAGPDIVMPCGVNSATLTATPLVTGATTSYGVSQITYSPYSFSTGTQVLANQDDHFSDSIALPFNFCFFGNVYKQVLVGANGVLSFNTANDNGHNNYQINDPVPSVNIPPDILNSIMAPWQDIDPQVKGNIYYQILGTAPCRMFIATWDSIPYYGSADSRDPLYCNTPLYASSQVVIYETTNIIDIYIRTKETCSQWNGGNAIEGIVDATGTAYAVVPGRNATAWTAQNDAWRFTPNGTPNYTTRWFDAGNRQIGAGDSYTVFNDTTLQATYTAVTTYTPCDGGAPIVVSDDVKVSHTGTLVSGIDSSTPVTCAGLSNGKAWAHATGGTGAVRFVWYFNGDSINNTLAISNLSEGTYIFTARDNSGCIQADSVTIGISSVNTLVANPITTNALCYQAKNGSINANPSGGSIPYSFIWSAPYGDQNVQILKGLAAGNYVVSVSDAMGCSVVATASVGDPPKLVATVDPTSITPVKCKGDHNGSVVVKPQGGTGPYASSATPDYVYFYSADSNGLITTLPAGDFDIVVFDNKGCQATTTVTVPDAKEDVYIPTTDSTSCYGPEYTDGSIGIVPDGANGPYQYSIDSVQFQYSNEFHNLPAGLYNVTIVNVNGCVTKLPVVVPEPLPIVVDVNPDSVFITLGGSQQVQVTYLNATNPYYEWTPSLGLSCIDCADPIVAPYESGDYVITVNMLNRNVVCHASATMHVEVGPHKPVFIPNSFTPNGDFNNDEFLVYGEGIKGVNLKVFNRMGELVFQTSNQFDGWDGRFKGQSLPPSVFAYDVVITFLDDIQVEKKGSVTLLR